MPTPASDVFVKAKVVDWSQRKYARGCYSHPSLGAPAAHAHQPLQLPANAAFASSSKSGLLQQ